MHGFASGTWTSIRPRPPGAPRAEQSSRCTTARSSKRGWLRLTTAIEERRRARLPQRAVAGASAPDWIAVARVVPQGSGRAQTRGGFTFRSAWLQGRRCRPTQRGRPRKLRRAAAAERFDQQTIAQWPDVCDNNLHDHDVKQSQLAEESQNFASLMTNFAEKALRVSI